MGEQDKQKTPAPEVRQLPQDIHGKTAPTARGLVELDPRVIKAGFDLTGYYIETGLRSFADYAQKMIEEYGYDVRPYLKSWYLSVRYYPGIDPTGMDSAAQVDEFMIAEDGYI